MTKITKKLMREVYPRSISYLKDVEEVRVYNGTEMHYGKYTSSHINIYELASKCKEWALLLGYSIETKYIKPKDEETYCICKVISYTDDYEMLNWTNLNSVIEPEAIFKACEWILEQKEIEL